MPVVIRRVYDMPDTRARGPIRVARVVEFMVDGQGPLFVEVPLEEMDSLAVRSLIETEAAKVRALLAGG